MASFAHSVVEGRGSSLLLLAVEASSWAVLLSYIVQVAVASSVVVAGNSSAVARIDCCFAACGIRCFGSAYHFRCLVGPLVHLLPFPGT